MTSTTDSEVKSLERKISADSSTGSSFENVDGVETSSTASDATDHVDTVAGSSAGEQEAIEKEMEEEGEEEVDPLDAPMKPEQEQFYTSKDTNRAVSNLIMFSSAMFVLPLLVMFSLYHYVFMDFFHWPADQAMLYAGLCGMSVVFIIVALFIYTAYKEEEQAEQRLKQGSSKKDD